MYFNVHSRQGRQCVALMALCLSGKIYKRDLAIIFAIVVLQTIFEPQWRVTHSVKPY